MSKIFMARASGAEEWDSTAKIVVNTVRCDVAASGNKSVVWALPSPPAIKV